MDNAFIIPTIDVRDRIPDNIIRLLARRIVDRFQPQKIILFGSYAYGKPRPESDIDLLVIMETVKRESQQAMQIRQYLNPLFGLDIIVYSPAKIKQRLAWGDSFLTEIVERGIVLYESLDAWMGRKSWGGFFTATRELRARKTPNYDDVCFHAQQLAEKYLKAALQENANTIPRTHSLVELMALCMNIDPAYQMVQSDLNILEGYAV